jgi:SAM-dependent methyltransferase
MIIPVVNAANAYIIKSVSVSASDDLFVPISNEVIGSHDVTLIELVNATLNRDSIANEVMIGVRYTNNEVSYTPDNCDNIAMYTVQEYLSAPSIVYDIFKKLQSTDPLYISVSKQVDKKDFNTIRALHTDYKVTREIIVNDGANVTQKVLKKEGLADTYKYQTTNIINAVFMTNVLKLYAKKPIDEPVIGGVEKNKGKQRPAPFGKGHTVNSNKQFTHITPQQSTHTEFRARVQWATTILDNWELVLYADCIFQKDQVKHYSDMLKTTNDDVWIGMSGTATEFYVVGRRSISLKDLNIIKFPEEIIEVNNRLSTKYENDTVINEISKLMRMSGSTVKRLTNNALGLDKIIYKDIYPPVDWYISEKIDGNHVIVYVRSNRLYILEDNITEVQLTSPVVPGTHLYEGELITLKDKSKILCVFDVMYIDSKNITKLPTSERFSHLNTAVENINTMINVAKTKPFTKSFAKQWKLIASKETLKDDIESVYNSIYPYEHDGIIFMDSDKGYLASTIYKWKPKEQITIDFYVVECPKSVLGRAPFIAREGKTLFWLCCGIRSDMFARLNKTLPCGYSEAFGDWPAIAGPNERRQSNSAFGKPPIQLPESEIKHRLAKSANYFPIPFAPPFNPTLYLYYNNPKTISDESIKNKIVEFIYEPTKDGNSWKFVRLRTERKSDLQGGDYFGNDYRTAEYNLMAWINPLELADLYNFTTGDTYFRQYKDDIYKSSTAFNSICKSTLIKYYCDNAWWVIDLAAGKGQDIGRFADAHVANVTAVELDKDAINELEKRRLTFNQIVSDYTLIQGDLRRPTDVLKDILAMRDKAPALSGQLADCIICNFAIHYFINSIANIAGLVRTLLKPGGKFIFTCFDGKKINELLKPLKNGESWTLIENINGEDIVKYRIEKRYEVKSTSLVVSARNEIKKIGVLLPFSQSELYEEELVDQSLVDSVMASAGFTKEVRGSFAPDEFSKTFNVQFPSICNRMTEADRQWVSLYCYSVYSKKTSSKGAAAYDKLVSDMVEVASTSPAPE